MSLSWQLPVLRSAAKPIERQSKYFDLWQACWQQVVKERSAAEVAQEMGVTKNFAYLAKSRVLCRLREELNGLLD